MALDFPNSPTNNQSFSAGGKTWVYNGTKWVLLGVSLNQTVSDGAITESKIASDAVTSAKIAAGAVGTTDLAANAVTQAKLASNLSGITVTTTANRDTDIPSPFTGQFCFLTDTSLLQRYTGSAWIVAIATAPAAPTALSATALSATSVSVAFTPGAENGSSITNYQYALSTNSGSTYGSFLALDPADSTSPITISGLSALTAYTIKLKAVNTMGAGTESAAVSVTTLGVTVDYLVVAGGGGGGGSISNATGSGGGGAGGLRSTVTATGGGGVLETALGLAPSTNYAVTVGSGGTSSANANGTNGNNSIFSTITSVGGGNGAGSLNSDATGSGNGGSGGGGARRLTGGTNMPGGTGTINQGFAGGNGNHTSGVRSTGGGGGGAASAGQDASTYIPANGGNGVAVLITGSSVTYGGGGGGSNDTAAGAGSGGSGGGGGAGSGSSVGTAGTVNTGGGGGGGGANSAGGTGGSGVVILRYSSVYTITIGAGLTGSTATVGGNKVTTITAGSGNVSWT